MHEVVGRLVLKDVRRLASIPNQGLESLMLQ